MANSVDPDETARYEPSHLDLHCLHMYMFGLQGWKGLTSLAKTEMLSSIKQTLQVEQIWKHYFKGANFGPLWTWWCVSKSAG